MINESGGRTMKALYRIDEVAEILSVSRRTVYRLLSEGVLTGHNHKPGKPGIRITAASLIEFIKRYELPPDYFLDKSLPLDQKEI